MSNEVKDIIKEFDSLPFLFVGSGFSRRYLDAPSWSGLLKHLLNTINQNDAYMYKRFENQATNKIKERGEEVSVNNLNTELADIIECEFNDNWYNDEKFEKSRNKDENKALVIEKGVSPFKLEIANYLKSLSNKEWLLKAELEKLSKITKNSVAGIITTNYDTLLERFFEFEKYIGQEKLIFSNPTGVAEIYKIHGCVTEPDSIVINTEDYRKFIDKNKYLTAKLLTIFIEHPIIFIGYSINDENIKIIIDSIIDCLNEEQILNLKKRFIFIEMAKDDQEECVNISEMIYKSNNKSMIMTKIVLKNYGILYESLLENKTKYPIKILRRLKDDIYDLTKTTNPTNRLLINLENVDNNSDDIEYVVGIGVISETGYSGYEAKDIYRDIVYDNMNFDNDILIKKTIPRLLKQNAGSIPFFKYLYGLEDENTIKDFEKEYEKYIINDIEGFYNNTLRNNREKSRYKKNTSIKQICKENEYPNCLNAIVSLEPDKLVINELRDYIINTMDMQDDILVQKTNSSNIKKLIRILDWLENKKS